VSLHAFCSRGPVVRTPIVTPEYLVQTDCEDCCNKLRFMGERKAGLQKLWNILGENSAGEQAMQRRMMLQLGHLEREGCIRLDQV
jgi:hypothetical protein